MNIYEFITPSDPITFRANDDKTAYVCSLLLGNGKAACKNATTDKSLPTMMMFSKDPEKEMSDFLGCDMGEFIKSNKQNISDCFASFAYGSVTDRKIFDDACDAITDETKLAEFKSKHEDQNRSSMSKWVQSAWNLSKNIK